jgi:hypothetical protein
LRRYKREYLNLFDGNQNDDPRGLFTTPCCVYSKINIYGTEANKAYRREFGQLKGENKAKEDWLGAQLQAVIEENGRYV